MQRVHLSWYRSVIADRKCGHYHKSMRASVDCVVRRVRSDKEIGDLGIVRLSESPEGVRAYGDIQPMSWPADIPIPVSVLSHRLDQAIASGIRDDIGAAAQVIVDYNVYNQRLLNKAKGLI